MATKGHSVTKDLVDAANEAFLDVMRASGKPEFADVTVDDLRKEAEHRIEQTRLPVIDVPTVTWWQRRLLSMTGVPTVDAQLRDMEQIVFDKAPINWMCTGTALDVPEPELGMHLGAHPHALLARGLKFIAQSSFAPELWVEFSTYFIDANSEGGLDAKRVFQVFVFYVYLNGSESQAKSISAILRICDELRSLRAEISAAKKLYRRQLLEVEAYLEALKAHERSGGGDPRPDWQNFITQGN